MLSFLLYKYTGVEWLDHTSPCLTSKTTVRMFSKVAEPFTFPPVMYEVSDLLKFLPIFSMVSLFNCSHSNRYRVVSQWDFPGGSMVKNLSANTWDSGSIPGSGRSPRKGNDNSLQYSCLENPMDRGVWWAQSMGLQRITQDWATSNNSFPLWF